jgi:hypothetical protein
MAKYVITDNQVKDFLLKTGGLRKLADSNFQLKKSELNSLVKTINQFKEDGDGELVPLPKVLPNLHRFNDLPDTFHEIPDKILEDFLVMVRKIDIKTHFPGFEIAFRFHIGHDNNAGGKLTYGIVITPICSPVIVPPAKRDHSLDLEDKLFIKHGVFFSLVVSGSQSAIITNDKKLCFETRKNKDPQSATELAYFTLEQLEKFRDGVKEKGRREKMSITFGRNAANSINLFLSFLDKSNTLLESAVVKGGILSNGVFFDDNDLVPPPFPVSDRSF